MEIKITVFSADSVCVCVLRLSSVIVKCNHGAAWFAGRIIKQDMSHTQCTNKNSGTKKESQKVEKVLVYRTGR